MVALPVVWAGEKDIEIAAPKFGSGLSKGDLPTIEKLIQEIWVDFAEWDVTIYELD